MRSVSDLTSNHRQQNTAQDARAWNPFIGIFALWAGLMWLMVRMMMIAVPLVALIIPVLIASYLWGEIGYAIALVIAGFAALPFWLPPKFKFFFPTYFDLLRLSGVFLQRVGRLRPQDTLGVVNRRWDALHADGRSLWRCWLARN